MEANVDYQLKQLISPEYKLFFTMLNLDKIMNLSFFHSFDGNLQLFCSKVLSSNVITDDKQDYESVSLRVIQMLDDEFDFVNDDLFFSNLLGTEYDLYFHTNVNILNELYVALNVTNTLIPLTNSFVFVFSGIKSSKLINKNPFVFDSKDYNYSIYEDLTNFIPLNELISNKKLSIREYTNILLQIVYSLTVAKRRNDFKHNNLLASNVLVSISKIKPFQIKLNDSFMITTVLPKMIDFSQSSVTVDGVKNEIISNDKSDIETFLEDSRLYGMNTWKYINDKMNNPEEYLTWLLEQFPLYFRINQQQNSEFKGLYCEFDQQCYSDETLNKLLLQEEEDNEIISLNSFFDVVMKELKIGVTNFYSEESLEENLEKLIQIVQEEIDVLTELAHFNITDIIQWNILKKYVYVIETITQDSIESKKLNELQLKMIEYIKSIRKEYNV